MTTLEAENEGLKAQHRRDIELRKAADQFLFSTDSNRMHTPEWDRLSRAYEFLYDAPTPAQPTTREDVERVMELLTFLITRSHFPQQPRDRKRLDRAEGAFTRLVARLRELEEGVELYDDLCAEVGDYINNPRSPEEKGKVIVQRWVSRITELEAENERLKKDLEASRSRNTAWAIKYSTAGEENRLAVLGAAIIVRRLPQPESDPLTEEALEELVDTIMDKNAELYQRLADGDDEEPTK